MRRKNSSVFEFAGELEVSDVSVIKQLFQQCDSDKDGELSVGELRNVIKELNIPTNENEIASLLKSLDKDGNSKISFKEFLSGIKWIQKSNRLVNSVPKDKLKRSGSIVDFISELQQDQLKEFKEYFDLCDEDHDGIITKAEFQKMFIEKLGLKTTQNDFEVLFDSLDYNGDGKLQFEEFISGMRWLNKGVNITKDNLAQTTTTTKQGEGDSVLSERNKILTNYLKEMINRGMEKAETLFKEKKYDTCRQVLDILDLEFLSDMEPFIGTVATKTQLKHFSTMKKKTNPPKPSK
eukprot:TRINITY_DN5474_c0_g2_i3.p1 TRINITY_DN5474_c0_g2~~TRINITY_DN5474_c0_g2_i3.p1  ORF type:complete len:293 (-),score=60.34 TRINITY_DN5474_c0_g2_i3:70-948(-)